MMKADINKRVRWASLFKRMEKGEMIQVLRGKKVIAYVRPVNPDALERAELDVIAESSVRKLAETIPPWEFEYREWKKRQTTGKKITKAPLT